MKGSNKMLVQLALIIEIFTSIICIHCIYGRRVKINIGTIVFAMLLLIFLDIVNVYELNGIASMLSLVLLLGYCIYQFKSTIRTAALSVIMYIIILTPIQFICMLLVEVCIPSDPMVRNVIGNSLVLIIGLLLSKCELHKLQKCIKGRNIFIFPFLGYMLFVIMLMLLQIKLFHGLQIGIFIFVIPAIIMILFMIKKWYHVQGIADSMEREMRLAKVTKETYNDLLVNVRIRQHELKNHVAAILSAHYAFKTYDKLVEAQEKYCRKILTENKYNNLLLMGNPILVGFLYEKFHEVEMDGISVNYKMESNFDNYKIQTYYLVEMIGILIDNAREALIYSDDKRMHCEILEKEREFIFSIQNPCDYATYEDITKWFEMDQSKKGAGRGIGLYHLKCLCEEWNCAISCRNVSVENKNWIRFVLEIKKA